MIRKAVEPEKGTTNADLETTTPDDEQREEKAKEEQEGEAT